jgi:2-keto-3-deoxy-L-rhamnonate aldolase RhmA
MTMRERISQAEPGVVGMILSEVRNPSVASMLATAGLDFFIVDMEHGSYDWETMAGLIAVARGAHIAPVVRIPEIRRETVLKPLDAGASCLLVPMVDHVAQAEEIVRHAKYAPQGGRGTALRRAHSHYRPGEPVGYMERANAETTIAIQIESRTALENVEALAAVPGVDVLFVGPFDLSISLGLPGQTWSDELRDAYRRVARAAQAQDKAAGIHLTDVEKARSVRDEGFRMLSVSSDIDLLIDRAASIAEGLRPHLGTARPGQDMV